MKAACRRTAEHLRFRSPSISHSVAILVLGLSFYSENPDIVCDTINVFMFTDLSLSAGLEAALLVWRWYAILGGGALTPFSNTSIILDNQRVDPVTTLESA